MINLVKKENLNLGILETDFDIFADIVNTFSSENLKKDCLADIDDYIVPEYFRNRITIAVQTNGMLIGYTIFEFKNNSNSTQVEINKLYVLDEFKNKNMESLLIEAVIYVAGEVGSRNVIVTVDEHDGTSLAIYKSLGFYEVGINEDGSLLSISVIAAVASRRLNDKFRNITPDSVDYKSLKLVKKIASGRSGNIYLTQDGRILKMFTSNSFTYIKDREETLRYIKTLEINEIVKPKNLVYYDGVFVGYIMEYLPDGKSLLEDSKNLSFEDKIERIKSIEKVMKKLHDKQIYICDLNPNNIFFDKKGNIKLIDCDAFVVKKNVVNNEVVQKYRDPINKIVSEKTDLYAFAVTTLQLLIDEKIDDDATFEEVEKIYNKNKNKLPISFKNYYDGVFKERNRYYLSDSYEKYLSEMYSTDEGVIDQLSSRSCKISVIILSIIMFVVALIGYLVFKFGINR